MRARRVAAKIGRPHLSRPVLPSPIPIPPFSDVVSKGKQTPSETSSTPSQVYLITLKSPSPPKKTCKSVEPHGERLPLPLPSPLPALSHSQTPFSPTPSSTALEQNTDTDSCGGRILRPTTICGLSIFSFPKAHFLKLNLLISRLLLKLVQYPNKFP